MKIIISPTKNMQLNYTAKNLTIDDTKILFAKEANEIWNTLLGLSRNELATLWKVNDGLLSENINRLKSQTLLQSQLTPALFAYTGIQFSKLKADELTKKELDYLQGHLYILSALYGLLRPYTGIIQYRLDMQTKLFVGECKNLYKYWGITLANYLATTKEIIINLASKEYAKAVTPYLPDSYPVINILFLEGKGGNYSEKGTYSKMARGAFVRFMAKNQITTVDALQKFKEEGYNFSVEHSNANNFVFTRGE